MTTGKGAAMGSARTAAAHWGGADEEISERSETVHLWPKLPGRPVWEDEKSADEKEDARRARMEGTETAAANDAVVGGVLAAAAASGATREGWEPREATPETVVRSSYPDIPESRSDDGVTEGKLRLAAIEVENEFLCAAAGAPAG
jgi:hypothetical protein